MLYVIFLLGIATTMMRTCFLVKTYNLEEYVRSFFSWHLKPKQINTHELLGNFTNV